MRVTCSRLDLRETLVSCKQTMSASSEVINFSTEDSRPAARNPFIFQLRIRIPRTAHRNLHDACLVASRSQTVVAPIRVTGHGFLISMFLRPSIVLILNVQTCQQTHAAILTVVFVFFFLIIDLKVAQFIRTCTGRHNTQPVS